MNIPFNALISRMKYITRWGLMHTTRTETLSEHTAETAIICHTLCVIGNTYYGGSINADKMAAAALYHDASEIITGDMPTPVKYKSAELKTAYKKLERDACAQLAELLPKEMKQSMQGYITGEALSDKEKQLLKAADRLSALIKCIEEEMSGNRELLGAKQSQLEALKQMHLPEAEFFIEHMLPCYYKTLDELTKQ